MMNTTYASNHDLFILEEIDKNPDATQASIAQKMNAAVGTVNWHIKRLVESGCVKVQRSEKRKLKYSITQKGSARRSELIKDYISDAMFLYREIRKEMSFILENIENKKYSSVFIDGSGDICEICKLSCIEKNIGVLDDPVNEFPTLKIRDIDLIYQEPIK